MYTIHIFPFLDLGATLYTITPTVLITVNFIYSVYDVVKPSLIEDIPEATYSPLVNIISK